MPREFDIRVCRGPVCAGQRRADDIHAQLAERIAARALGAVVTLERQSCFGRCFLGPNVHVRERAPAAPAVAIQSGGAGAAPARVSALYSGVSAGDADEILSVHVLDGRVVERLMRRIAPAAPAAPPAAARPDVRLATGLAPPEASAAPDAMPGPEKDPEPSADVAPDPR